MEIRQTYRGGGVRKGLIVLATCAAVAAAVAGAAITNDLKSSASTPNSGANAGSVLRQAGPVHGAPLLLDRNAEQQAPAPAAAIHTGRSSGNQSVPESIVGSQPGLTQGSTSQSPLSDCEFVGTHKAC